MLHVTTSKNVLQMCYAKTFAKIENVAKHLQNIFANVLAR